MRTRLLSETFEEIGPRLAAANVAVMRRYAGETGRRQPVHTVYGGAHLFRADSAPKLGTTALRTLKEYAPDARTFAGVLGLPKSLAQTVYTRVREKLRREPVEDFRLDFEDGYGNRPDSEEDGHAESAAAEVAAGVKAGSLPPFLGIRIKPLNEELRNRSLRTLEIFLVSLVEKTYGHLPGNFFITLPKITSPAQVAALAEVFEKLEAALRLAAGTLKMELMIETTQSILNERGECSLPLLLAAANGRCTAAHFGTYDYTAACGITAAYQHMAHPACDFARRLMQVAFAGTGVWLSDGATNILPVPLHRAVKGGRLLTRAERAENRTAVHRAWKLHVEHIRHSLVNGFYQGWDLHPAQLPTRYAAVYAFFLEGLHSAGERLRNFIGKAAQATLVGEVFDDAATGQGLLNYFLRAINCGAVTEEEAQRRSGLTLEELRSGSFVKILERRRGQG